MHGVNERKTRMNSRRSLVSPTDSKLDEYIGKLEQSRNPQPEPQQKMVSVSAKVTRGQADWISAIAKEMKISRPRLVSALLEESLSKLEQADGRITRPS